MCGTCDDTIDYCALEDACAPGDVDVKECGFCGYQTRTCDEACLWGAWSDCVGGGECTAGTTEACDTGCGVKTCLNNCSYGECASTLDTFENNNFKLNAYKYMAEPLEEGQVLSTTSPAWLHSTLDVDWYAVDIVESGGLDWSLVIDAKLSGGVDGLREICIFYDRKSDGTTDFSKCESGSSEILNVSLGDIDNVGANDDGTLFIRVEGEPGCDAYYLTISAD